MEKVHFNGWDNNVRLANGEIELIVSSDVGPRVVRAGFLDGPNLFAEIEGQQGGTGETEWMIRGGHRLWIAPEAKPRSYELDNVPVRTEVIDGGVRTLQPAGPHTGIAKSMDICLDASANVATITHRLTNEGKAPFELAPWALSVMAPTGQALIPLPARIAHTDRLTHNQEWSIWGYTDFSDPRWTMGARYLLFRQDTTRGPNKLGLAQREGWVAYQLGEFLFVKEFDWVEGGVYPDGGVNFETFSNEEFLEVESLAPLVTLDGGQTAEHVERWRLFRGVPACSNDADVEAHIRPLL